MKKFIISLCAVMVAVALHAEGITVMPRDVKIELAGGDLVIGMTLDLSELPVKSNMSLTMTPVLKGDGGECVVLPPVTVAGRGRYYTLRRERDPEASDFMFFRFSKGMAPYNYAAMVPFQPWMRVAQLSLETATEGCCSKDLGFASVSVERLSVNITDAIDMLADFEYAFITPAAEAVKVREIEGEALIDFKVNQTVILPEFGRNPGELAKIRQSIDAIRDNSDTRILLLTITGYASPEGSFANNERLARGRTAAVADYVSTLYKFPAEIVDTASVAEDWEGVRRFLTDNPRFDNRDAILAIVDAKMDPDAKDARIRTEYPVAYKYMLDNVYPPLRHTEYKVGYEVRSYTTPEEIAEVFRSRPGDLSLKEMYVLANTYPEGSDEYAEVFETAARIFPKSDVAAVNAAFAEMQRQDYTGAARYLERAGDLPETVYARGLLAAYIGDYAKAHSLLEQAKRLGVSQAETALETLKNLDTIQTIK